MNIVPRTTKVGQAKTDLQATEEGHSGGLAVWVEWRVAGRLLRVSHPQRPAAQHGAMETLDWKASGFPTEGPSCGTHSPGSWLVNSCIPQAISLPLHSWGFLQEGCGLVTLEGMGLEGSSDTEISRLYKESHVDGH